MKRFLSLIALVAVALVSCEPVENPENNTPEDNTPEAPQDSEPSLQIKLESESVMNFTSAGGAGTISYVFDNKETENKDDAEAAAETRNSPVPLVATATTTVEWISNFQSTEDLKITFDVLANESYENRSANIKVAYGESSFYVRVQQEGVAKADVVFTATHLGGSYYGKYINTKGFNYFVILGDMQAEHYQSKQEAATEYRFDIYSECGSPFNSTHRVPVGTYKIDHRSTGDPGTIDGSENCSYYFNTNYTTASYIEATLIVTEDSISAEVTFADGQLHRIEYHGDCVMEDYILDTYADVYPVSQYTKDITFDVKNGSINAYFRGDYFGIGSDVWFMDMVESVSPYNGVYLVFDLIVPKDLGGLENQDGFLGEYTIHNDSTTSYDYTIPVGRLRDDSLQMHAWYLVCESSMVDMSKAAPFTAGTIKVTKEGNTVTFDINGADDNGNKIVGKFSGLVVSYYDQKCE